MSEPALSSFFLPSGAPSESLLRLIADSVPAMMAYFDLPEMRCRFANQSYADYIGRAVPAILGDAPAEHWVTRFVPPPIEDAPVEQMVHQED